MLELDTVRFIPSGTTATVYAVVENISIPDLPKLSFQKDLHCNLIENYRKKDWNFCSQAIENLVGNFGGELDTFYTDLLDRVKKHKETGVSDDWEATLIK